MRGDARLGAILVVFILTVVIFSQAGPVSRAKRMLSADRLKYEPIYEPTGIIQELIAESSRSNETTGAIRELNVESLRNSESSGAFQELAGESSRNSSIEGGCIYGDRAYGLDESVPSSKLCETCTCTENGIQCVAIVCKIQPGCKALHRADHCCPLYQCECERNGIKYSNGEKLMDPDNPCQVCYCQGGAILCNPIACYRRDDCEPRYVPGRCCPEYDHCPPRDNISPSTIRENTSSNKPEMHKILDTTTIGYSNDNEGMITENIKQFVLIDDLNDDSKSNSKTSININQNKNVSTLTIKEVTGVYEKSINNEIRIKEVLPTVNSDFSSTDSNKSPSVPREVNTDQIKETVTLDGGNDADVKNYTDNLNAYQAPPILRIGDRLLFLTDGDFVPENASMNTPAPIFTVIGAEGLQRVIDDPEETFDNRYLKDENQHEEPQNEIIQDDLNDIYNSTDYNITDITANSSQSYTEKNEIFQKNSDLIPDEDPEQILQEVVSELYETTTMAAEDASSEENMKGKSSDYIDFNIIRKDAKLESGSEEIDTSREAESSESTTFEPQIASVKSIHNIFDDDQQAIPVEHLPEHNPEYPPIPEDIMILSMTEDSIETVSSESEYSGSHPITNIDNKNDERIILVKRPVIGHPVFSSVNKEKMNNEKIVPGVFELIKDNETTSDDRGTSTLMPEDWLKSEEPETVNGELDSPLLNLNSALPNSILLSSPEFKASNEDDDSRDYIFISNITTDLSPSTVEKQELFTEEPTGLTDAIEIINLRSPGEPLLVPEWERNQTSENITNDESNVDVDVIKASDYFSTDRSISSNDQLTNAATRREDDDIEKYVPYPNENDSSPVEDTITNFIISTENTIIVKSPAIESIEKERNTALENTFSGDTSVHTKKQKKTSSLVAEEKNDNSNDSVKKGNILADLISLVGDVASIGNQDIEVSSVRNAIDEEGDQKLIDIKGVDQKNEFTTTSNRMLTQSDFSRTSANLELSEYSDEKIENPPMENDKVEFTTKKMFIDKDSDERNMWKSTDHIIKDIEIISKESNVNVKKPSLEKFVNNNKEENKNSILDKTKLVLSDSVLTTGTPVKKEKIDAKENLPTTLSTLLSTLAESAKSNDSESSKLLNNILQTVTIERAETTESSYPTVMKVSTKSDANSIDKSDEDKLTKRETNSQLRETSGQIDESLISILRDFFEKQYRH